MIYGNDIIQFLSASELTISSDAITITQGNHKLQPQSGTADDLSTINGTVDGNFGVLYISDFGTDTITIKHNVGNILCVGARDITISYGCVYWYSNGTKVFVAGMSPSVLTGKQSANLAMSATTPVTDVTGVSLTVTSGKEYAFEFEAGVDCNATSGFRLRMSNGSCTVSVFSARYVYIDNTANSVGKGSRVTAIGTLVSVTGGTDYSVRVSGRFTCNGTGTFVPGFALQTGTTTATIKNGVLKVWEI